MDKHNNQREQIIDDDDIEIDSFQMYRESDDENSKIIDNEKIIKSFNLYEED